MKTVKPGNTPDSANAVVGIVVTKGSENIVTYAGLYSENYLNDFNGIKDNKPFNIVSVSDENIDSLCQNLNESGRKNIYDSLQAKLDNKYKVSLLVTYAKSEDDLENEIAKQVFKRYVTHSRVPECMVQRSELNPGECEIG